MQSRNALARALLILAVATSLVVIEASSANADDGTTVPRALPAARSMPRAFATYDALVTYATRIAADQSALDERSLDTTAQFQAVMAQLGDASARLASVTADRGRGGALYDIDAETLSRDTHAQEAALSVKAVSLYHTQQELTAAGALSAPASGWRMPTIGQITQPFGPTEIGIEPAKTYHGVSYAHFHEGVDIAGAWAADVVAPARGRVVFVGAMMDGAEVVVIAHDGGLVSMYAHLDNSAHPPTVAAGDEVAAGQKIGTVGMTGIVTGAHLHWAVWRNGELVDPLSLVGK